MTTTTTTFSTSFSNTPQAQGDLYNLSEDSLVAWYTQLYLAMGKTWDGKTIDLDVMANDRGGAAKVLWSLDDAEAKDLLTAKETSWEKTATGNWIRIFGGKVEYKLGDGSDDHARARTIDSLGAGQDVADSFVYAIRLGNGTLSYATVHINIDGANDLATIGGTAAGEVAEDAAPSTASGRLTVSDVDTGEAELRAVAAGTAGAQGYGSFAVAAEGGWTYTLDNGLAAVQALGAGATLSDSITVWSEDGTDSEQIVVTIRGANDAPELTGTAAVLAAGAEDTAYTVTRAQLLQGWTDVDLDDALSVTDLAATNGALVLNADGSYTITPGQDYFGTVTLTYGVTDGNGGTVAASLSYSLAPVNDAATIGGAATGRVTEDATPNTVSGQLTVSDPDGTAEESFAAVTGGATARGYGSFAVTAGGSWTYTLDNANPTVDALGTGATLTDSFDVLSADGTRRTVTVTIDGATDAPADTARPTDIRLEASAFIVDRVSANLQLQAGNSLGRLRVADDDPAATVALLEGSSSSFVVVKVGDAYELRVASPLSSSNVPSGSHVVRLVATDSAGNAYYEDIQIRVGTSSADGSLQGTQADSSRTGAAAASAVVGDDAIFGYNGGDTLNTATGSGGITLNGTSGDDVLFGGRANDALHGGSGADSLFGGEDADTLEGGDGADRLEGGLGQDTLRGGLGNDVFAFRASAESAGSAFDTVADFARGSDRIDLSAIDANPGAPDDQAFAFLGLAAAFTGVGQLRAVVTGSGALAVTTIHGNTDSDLSTSEFVLRLSGDFSGANALTASDFIL